MSETTRLQNLTIEILRIAKDFIEYQNSLKSCYGDGEILYQVEGPYELMTEKELLKYYIKTNHIKLNHANTKH